jgi:putative ABC transport system substrate-binding protein
LARELVEAKPDVIIAVTTLGAIELKKLTNTIPIVIVITPDPVLLGLVDSLAHPGGNVTGLSFLMTDLSGKRLGLLKEAVPNLSRVVFLVDLTVTDKEHAIKAYQSASETLRISLRSAEIVAADEIDPVFAKIAQEGADGVVWAGGGLIFAERARMGAAALTHRLPAVVAAAEAVPYGPLMSYGPDIPDYFRRAVGYTDKILKGARPADLPVEQPTRFKLVLNLKTVKAPGLIIPQTLLISADEVIE